MIKKIKRLLEVGEETKESDLLYALESYSNRWEEFGVISKAGSRPISRETLVLELPPIPEGFRLVTLKDQNNKLKGEIKFLVFGSELCWSTSEKEGRIDFYELEDHLYIIKPKQKGFTIKDVAPGTTFFLGNIPYEVSHFEVNGCIALRDFGGITIEILNKHFSYSDSGKITPCSEYQR